MSGSNWEANLTEWAAYIGAITGVIGLLLGIKHQFWTTHHSLATERLHLRNEVATAKERLYETKRKVSIAQGSRTSIFAASGLARSGAMEAFKQQVVRDQATLDELAKNMPPSDETFKHLNYAEVANIRHDIHSLATQINTINDRYSESIGEDRRMQDQRTSLLKR